MRETTDTVVLICLTAKLLNIMLSYLHLPVPGQGPSEYLKMLWFQIPFFPQPVSRNTPSRAQRVPSLDFFDCILLYVVSFSIVLSSISWPGLVSAEEGAGGGIGRRVSGRCSVCWSSLLAPD